jgi:hypothetical protein
VNSKFTALIYYFILKFYNFTKPYLLPWTWWEPTMYFTQYCDLHLKFTNLHLQHAKVILQLLLSCWRNPFRLTHKKQHPKDPKSSFHHKYYHENYIKLMCCTMDIKCTLNEWKKAQSDAEPRIDIMAIQACTLNENAGPHDLSLYFFFKNVADTRSYQANFI